MLGIVAPFKDYLTGIVYMNTTFSEGFLPRERLSDKIVQ